MSAVPRPAAGSEHRRAHPNSAVVKAAGSDFQRLRHALALRLDVVQTPQHERHRARVSAVRGVNCDGVLRTLLTRGLVYEVGVDHATQGTLFCTTILFSTSRGTPSLYVTHV